MSSPAPVSDFKTPPELNLMVDATNRCQLDCKYCYFGCKGKDTMNPTTTAQAIKNTIAGMNGSLRKVDIHYMGGEPLMAWPQILEVNAAVRSACEERGLPFTWGLTSNLVGLDQKKADHMKTEKAGIHCSIDGPREVQDKNRPFPSGGSSFDRVAKNIPRALEITPNDTARVTVCPEDAANLPKIADTILGLGFKRVGLFPAYNMGWNERSITKWATNIARVYESTKVDGRSRISTIIRQRIGDRRKSFTYCGAGRALWAMDVRGRLYHCHHFTNKPELAIVDAVNVAPDDIVQAISASTLAPFGKPIPDKCLSCPANPQCNGMCWSNNLLNTGNSTEPTPIECQMYVATHGTLWPIMEPDFWKQHKREACHRCYSCQNCYSNCDSCQGCDTCQSCQTCQSCDTCQRTCERNCQSCDTCQGCDSSCEKYCESCQRGCEVRCDGGCQSCDNCEGCDLRCYSPD